MRGDRGAALVLALLVTAALSALIVEIITTVHGQARRTENLVAGNKAALMAEGGVELAADYLKGLDKGYTYLDKDTWTSPVEDALLEIEVEDESGKLSANSIVFPNGETNEAAYGSFRALLAKAGMDTAVAEALADWLDADDNTRSQGAEGAYYARLPAPYRPKNGRLDTVGELALVKGFDAGKAQALASYLTVYGDAMVNINTAPVEVITSLAPEITAVMAERLVERRSQRPFTNTSEVGSVSGFETLVFSLQGRIKVKSDIFRVRTRASSGGVVREVEAIVRTGADKKVLYWRAR